MALKYPSEWKFEGIGFPITNEAYRQLFELILKVAKGDDNPKGVIEQFKVGFGATSASSSYDWAVNDLGTVMENDLSNAAAFVEAYWTSIVALSNDGVSVPSAKVINDILHNHNVPLTIDPPNLLLQGDDSILIEEQEEEVGINNSYSVPNYRLGDKLGEGGFGTVYSAKRVTRIAEFGRLPNLS